MSALVALAALALLVGLAAPFVRRIRALEREVESLTEALGELSARLDAAEQDAANALTRAEVSESVLLDKGVADEDDLEAARARSNGPDAPRAREGGLH